MRARPHLWALRLLGVGREVEPDDSTMSEQRSPKFVLIFQWATGEFFGFDELVEKEEAISAALGSDDILDGHDMGSGEANVFVLTNEPEALFKKLSGSVLKDDLNDIKAAYRKLSDEQFTVLWPPGET
jgi:hypothetical protein